jgi:hypothetical protein
MRFHERSLGGDGSGWDAYLRYSALSWNQPLRCENLFPFRDRTALAEQRIKGTVAGRFYQLAHLIGEAISAEHREHRKTRESKDHVDGVQPRPS